jgi:glycosyltransferase involved in cell wall biosynthesis
MATLAGLRGTAPVDLVFATSPPLSVGLIGWMIARLRGARFMLDIRDLWPAVVEALGAVRQPGAIRLMEVLERFLYRRADHITTVTRGFVTHIQAIVKQPERVTWLPNGAATDLFDPAHRDDALRARLGLDGFVVTFAGLHGLAQGLDTVLAAAERLRDERMAFVLIGDGPAKPALVASARARGLTNVRFLDTVPISGIAPYLIASDALLVPLRADSIFQAFVPSKLYDALACARPVVLSVDGEARAILEGSGGGVFCPPGDAERLAHTLMALARTPEKTRAQMGERGRAFVLRHFTRATQAAALVRLASAVAARHDRASPAATRRA